MYGKLTRASPGGCILTVFGLAAWIYAALAGWALHLAASVPPAQRNSRLIAFLWVTVAVSFVVGALLLWLSWRLARVADMSNPDKPPMVRF
jgi:uncharacterized membrane protein